MLSDEIINKVSADIAHNHRKIIDDWCKAYLAQKYQEDGKIPKPGDFILTHQLDNNSPIGGKYWFDKKELEIKD